MSSKAKSRGAATHRRLFSSQLIVGLVGASVMSIALFILVARPNASTAPGNVAGAAASVTLPTSDGQTIALPGNPRSDHRSLHNGILV